MSTWEWCPICRACHAGRCVWRKSPSSPFGPSLRRDIAELFAEAARKGHRRRHVETGFSVAREKVSTSSGELLHRWWVPIARGVGRNTEDRMGKYRRKVDAMLRSRRRVYVITPDFVGWR